MKLTRERVAREFARGVVTVPSPDGIGTKYCLLDDVIDDYSCSTLHHSRA